MTAKHASTDRAANPGIPLKRTPLYDLLVERGGRMVPFAGFEMPVQFPAGILKEHAHTREAASLFDVSHMGQFALHPKSGKIEDAGRALEALVPADIQGLEPHRQRYTVLTNDDGGILDDLIVGNHGDHLSLVVNAERVDADYTYLQSHLSDVCTLEICDRALIALQGPKAAAALTHRISGCASMRFMDVRTFTVLGQFCPVSRSGYTGEDGFEISLPADMASTFAERLLDNDDVLPAGLGARDSLRMEAGLPLYGADLDESTTPVEAGLAWSIPKVRRRGGDRAGGFPGDSVILAQIETGTKRMRTGLRAEGRAPVRAGAPLYTADVGGNLAGAVTSGGFGPTVGAPIAMAYLPEDLAVPDKTVFGEVRGKRHGLEVTSLPFVAHRYRRS